VVQNTFSHPKYYIAYVSTKSIISDNDNHKESHMNNMLTKLIGAVLQHRVSNILQQSASISHWMNFVLFHNLYQ